MKQLVILLLIVVSCGKKEIIASEGELKEEQFFSKILNKNWEYTVYYPHKYSKNIQYPVIYLLHGAFESHKSWQQYGDIQSILDNLISHKKLSPAIVIMPNGENSWYVDSSIAKMESAIEQDLFPYIESNFNIINNKNSRVIGGISMGGYGALKFGFRNSDYFGSVISLSPAISKLKKSPSTSLKLMLDQGFASIFENPFSQDKWDRISYIHDFTNFRETENPTNLYIFVANGTLDIITPLRDSRDLVHILKVYNIEHEYHEMQGENHWWQSWKPILEQSFINIAPRLTNTNL